MQQARLSENLKCLSIEKFQVPLWHHEWQIPYIQTVQAQIIRNILCSYHLAINIYITYET